jgi:hypothetical protein
LEGHLVVNSGVVKAEHIKTMMESPHPASLWAAEAPLDPLQIDCVTAVMLKILDHKCKMPPEEQMAVMAIYQEVKGRKSLLFDDSIHAAIHNAMHARLGDSAERIHQLRIQAEAMIPKPVMKHFKRYMRESLYGLY